MHSLRAIARQHEVTHHSLRRHLLGHVDPALADAAREVLGLGALRIAERLREAAQSATDVRRWAEDYGSPDQARRAVATEVAAWSTVADRLGIDHAGLVRDIAESEALLDAVGTVVHSDPDAGLVFAAAIESNGRPDLAADIRNMIHAKTKTRALEAVR